MKNEVIILGNKKTFLLILSVFLIIIAISLYLFWVIESKYIEIPEPVVMWENGKVEIPLATVRINYSNKFKQRYNFCGGEQSLIEQILKPTHILPNEEISIIFEEKPTRCTVFERQDNGNYKVILENSFKEKSDYVKTLYFKLPSKPGRYVYSLWIDYPVGEGVYYFSIEVVDDKTDDIK